MIISYRVPSSGQIVPEYLTAISSGFQVLYRLCEFASIEVEKKGSLVRPTVRLVPTIETVKRYNKC
ncbi:hypothetical protein GCK32_013060 [Trichostrongylus colubriformis]|uniref:Uncharacterized protein n=1 Tax=Trichostrongylus colubriformis TaxID=6319 RepID=A0AAN8FUV7_TRICO